MDRSFALKLLVPMFLAAVFFFLVSVPVSADPVIIPPPPVDDSGGPAGAPADPPASVFDFLGFLNPQ